MKDITKFGNVTGTPSGLANALDTVGSTQDSVFAEAILANEPSSILEESGIVTVRQVPAEVDEIQFPIVRNTQFTWTAIDGRSVTNSLGSDFNASKLTAVEYRKVRPVTNTANIFLPDTVSLLNKVNFDMYAKIGAVEAKRKKEADTLLVLCGLASDGAIRTTAETGYVASNLRPAGAIFTMGGSVITGSTLGPIDLVKSKRVLTVGSNISVPDFVLMHPTQYEQLNSHADFAPGATSRGAMLRKAKFNDDGDIVRFDGMDVYVSELIPSVVGSDTTAWVNNGHPVIVGAKGKAVGLGEHSGIVVSTEDSRRLHGQWKIFDVDYASTLLVAESLVLLRATDA